MMPQQTTTTNTQDLYKVMGYFQTPDDTEPIAQVCASQRAAQQVVRQILRTELEWQELAVPQQELAKPEGCVWLDNNNNMTTPHDAGLRWQIVWAPGIAEINDTWGSYFCDVWSTPVHIIEEENEETSQGGNQ